jgi:4-hydroxy-tetrahydrodipicolinate synthase
LIPTGVGAPQQDDPVRTLSTFACVITAFDAEGSLDEPAMAEHLDRIGAAGVGVYLGSSSPGEGYTLTAQELERLYVTGVETLKGRVPVRAMGVEPRSADEMSTLVAIAEGCGLDAIQLYCLDLGHSNKPSEAELERYFRDVLERMNVTALLSSHIFGGYAIPLDMIARLLDDYEHLIGINCTNPDLKYVSGVIDVARGRADVHVGGPMQALSALSMGGQGFLSSEANIAPELCRSIVDAFEDGDLERLASSYAKVMRIFSANQSSTGSTRWTKSVLAALGLPGGNLRPPQLPLADWEIAEASVKLQQLELQPSGRKV